MTPEDQIQLSVNGYKCLRDYEVNFGEFNLITGRNNSGKTSILEALQLGLDPTSITQYKNNVDSIINIYEEEVDICCSFSGNQYKLNIQKATEEETINIYTEVLEEFNPRYRFMADPEMVSEDEHEELYEITVDFVIDKLQDSGDDIIDSARNYSYILEYNGKKTGFIHLSDFHQQFSQLIRDQYIGELIEEIRENTEIENSKFDLDHYVFRLIDSVFPHREDYFQRRLEPEVNVSLIRSPIIKGNPRVDDPERAAIKKTEIRDYLNAHNILDDKIEDFGFNEIVIEDKEGQRRSISYEFTGDGFKTIVGILWELIDEPDSDIIMLEEPENHMHPGYIEELIPFLVSVAKDNEKHLMISTHNIDFIRGLLSDDLPDEIREYAEENLQVIQTTNGFPQQLDYEDCKEQSEELYIDLRGI